MIPYYFIYDLKTNYFPKYYETNEIKLKILNGIDWLKMPRILLMVDINNDIIKSHVQIIIFNKITEKIIQEYRKKYVNDNV